MKIEFDVGEYFIKEDPKAKIFLDGIQKMLNRMSMSHFKYNNMDTKYPHSARAIDSAVERQELYTKTGNTEHCLDAANFLVIEFVLPSHPKSHFKSEPSNNSPGVKHRED